MPRDPKKKLRCVALFAPVLRVRGLFPPPKPLLAQIMMRTGGGGADSWGPKARRRLWGTHLWKLSECATDGVLKKANWPLDARTPLARRFQDAHRVWPQGAQGRQVGLRMGAARGASASCAPAGVCSNGEPTRSMGRREWSEGSSRAATS